MLGFLREISATAAGTDRGNVACEMTVGIRYSRNIRNRYSATVIAGRVSETMAGPKVRAVALSRGIRHDVTAVHVGDGRTVRANALSDAARGERQHAEILRLDATLRNRCGAQPFLQGAIQGGIAPEAHNLRQI